MWRSVSQAGHDVSIAGQARVTGVATLQGGVNVTHGAAVFAGDLLVTSVGEALAAVPGSRRLVATQHQASVRTAGGVAVGQSLHVSQSLNVGGTAFLGNDTDVAGSLSVAQHAQLATTVNVGGDLTVAGIHMVTNTLDATAPGADASIVTMGGVAVGKSVHVGGSLEVATNGQVAGDVGVGGGVIVAGVLSISNAMEATAPTAAASVSTSGGVAIAKSLQVGGEVMVAGNTVHAGTVDITSSMDATSLGAIASIRTLGGASIGKSLWVGGGLSVTGDLSFAHLSGQHVSSSGTLEVKGDSSLQGSLHVLGMLLPSTRHARAQVPVLTVCCVVAFAVLRSFGHRVERQHRLRGRVVCHQRHNPPRWRVGD